MPKVLCIVPNSYVYGVESLTLSLFGRLSEETRSHFFLSRWTDGEFAQRLEARGIPYTYSWMGSISRRLNWRNLRWTADALSKLPILYRDYVNMIKVYKPNIIYTTTHRHLILLWPLLVSYDIPVVCHMHDPPPAIPFQRFTASFWDPVVNHYIAISDSVKSRLRKLGVELSKIVLLYDGIDLGRFPYVERRSDLFVKQFGWPSEAVIVGMTGQLIEEKGHIDLLRAAQMIKEECTNARLVIGGKQVEPYYGQLRKWVADHELDGAVAFSGWQADVKDFYAGIDIFALPSRHEEGFGLVVAEAMATGRPVVATRSGGASEVVEDSRTGVLVEKRAPSQLADAICFLATSPAVRRVMGEAGRRRVESHFDLSRQVRRFEKILTQVTNSHGG